MSNRRQQRERPSESPPTRREISAARFAIFFTLLAWAAYVVDQVRRTVDVGLDARSIAETGLYLVLVSALALSALAYLVARLGRLYRRRDHRPVPRAVIDRDLGPRPPTLTALVPSYREDARVIRQTLVSAALQEYPDIHVVLLIDDPPNASSAEHLRLLDEARAVVAELDELLAEPAAAAREIHQLFADDDAQGPVDRIMLEALATAYDEAAGWIHRLAVDVATHVDADHSDQFLRTHVLGGLVDDLTVTADALETAAGDARAYISHERAGQLARRLAAIFSASFSVFERKRFASLSHEANKAMNLNSYLGLMGGDYSVQTSPGGSVLIPSDPDTADLSIADADYVLTLDADSVLLPEYCLRLIHFMERPEHARVAVVQTPYSAYPGAETRLERLAGATTDIQHLVHQGLTHYGATFWVGANAILRKRAIDELRVDDHERGFPIRRYIADRTVIEDTESSIDLRAAGWQLANYPERLSYSATPPDYGSLVVQRKRWANGGLVIFPKLVRYWRRRRRDDDAPSVLEVFLRANYLASITWSSLGLLVLLLYPFDQRMISSYAVLTALPYFVAMASDLRRVGYRRLDMLRLYGFNLLLLPVNLAGSVSSMVQAIGGQKVDFARTPKVRGRTAASLLFVVTPIAMLLWSAYSLVRDIHHDLFVRAAFAGVNAITLLYAVVAFIGVRHAFVDIVLGLRELTYVERDRDDDHELVVPHWTSVLYVGANGDAGDSTTPLAAALAAHDQNVAFGGSPSVDQPVAEPIAEEVRS